jgi:cell wall-associated NlpC family hydrolase
VGTIINLKKAAVAEGLNLRLPGWAKTPPFDVTMTEEAGGYYRQLLREIAASKTKTTASRDITLKRLAVAEGKVLKLKGWNASPPFGVTLTAGRGDRIDALLLAISKARIVPPKVWTRTAIALHCHAVGRPYIYTQGDVAGSPTRDRMQGVRKHLRAPDTPTEGDCSSTCIWFSYAIGAPDPNGTGYNCTGYTGSLIGRGVRVSTPAPDDLVFYTEDGRTSCHVATYVGNGMVVSHGVPGGPQLLAVHNMAGLAVLEYRRYPSH